MDRNAIVQGTLVGSAAAAMAGLLLVQTLSTPVAQASPPAFVHDPSSSSIAMSGDAHDVVDWIVATNDAGGQPFVVVDKRNARLFVFDGRGALHADTAILMGGVIGDGLAPGERTTPAGKFAGDLKRGARGENVVRMDRVAGIAISAVLADESDMRLPERLTPYLIDDDDRILCSCVNVPVDFFDREVAPLFATRTLPIYILPEERALSDVFAWDVAQLGGMELLPELWVTEAAQSSH